VNAEPRQDLIEYKGGLCLLCDLTQLVKEFPWPHVRMTAAHGLDQNGGQIMATTPQDLQRLFATVFE